MHTTSNKLLVINIMLTIKFPVQNERNHQNGDNALFALGHTDQVLSIENINTLSS